MKSLITAVAAATALTASFAASAQTNGPVTRAQVRAELVQLERAGYRPGVASPYYPDDIQAAQARVAGTDTSGYGPQAAPTVRSGSPGAPAQVARDSIYRGH
ncbi:DUF4148 domain-containing protein [Burkholderia glumae]|uniref:DUF4148 domain-containing protein n=1 Tax=Burkholderia glumae TaxID=337 RepID=UPI000C277DE9|nr:DUF4148 domain-containing protein [Burkholderia glumae]PJO22161.1 purine-nucleoside phosphorylase [Burkholderia glumae AU6208]QHE12618.1 DUF4148 domain-containing protein [Burkholderia glumae AU6208]QJP70249.1 DUF4148 domain-containing protein [Burkholderia glumae]